MINIVNYIIGIDIGGTLIRVALCTEDLNEANMIVKSKETPKDTEYSIANSLITMITEILYDYEVKVEQLVGIGLASAGPLDMEKGVIFNNANLGFKVIHLKAPLQEKFPGTPIFMINDCNASVLGVHYFEANDEEKQNLVYITMSTGIGGGVICNGRLLLGKEGNAAEIGHGVVDPSSLFQCNCGAHGCWEVYSSGSGIKNRAMESIKDTKLSSRILMIMIDNEIEKINAKYVFQAAKGGDKFSKSIINMSIYYSKIGIGLVNNYYDCSSIYFGGAIMHDQELIIPELKRQFETDPIQYTINHPPKIKVTKYLDDVGLRGALVLVKYKLEGNPVIP